MPPIRFEYTRLDLSNLWPDTVTGSPREALSDPDTTLISFTGNARVDVLQTRNGHRCFVNGGRSGAAVAVQGQELASSPQVELSRSDTWLRDVNGRGSVDLSTESFYYHNPATSPTPVAPGALDWETSRPSARPSRIRCSRRANDPSHGRWTSTATGTSTCCRPVPTS